MLSFSEFIKLDEGITKIPPKVKQKTHQYLYEAILGVMYDNVQEYKDEYPKFYKYFMRLASKYRVKRGHNEKVFEKKINFDQRGMASNYPRLETSRLTYIVYVGDGSIKSLKFKVGGFFRPEGSQLVINAAIHDFYKYPNRIRSPLDTFKNSIKDLETTLEHELIHAVQSKQLVGLNSTEEVQAKYPKATDEEVYYLSGHEFDPQIVSAAKNLSDQVDVFGDNKSTQEIFDKFVGITKTKSRLPGGSSKFFLALKNNDEKRWRIAVRKLLDLLKKKYRIELENKK